MPVSLSLTITTTATTTTPDTQQFIPGTEDQVVVALKSEEIEEEQTQTTFIMVFTLDGEVLLEETEVRKV